MPRFSVGSLDVQARKIAGALIRKLDRPPVEVEAKFWIILSEQDGAVVGVFAYPHSTLLDVVAREVAIG